MSLTRLLVSASYGLVIGTIFASGVEYLAKLAEVKPDMSRDIADVVRITAASAITYLVHRKIKSREYPYRSKK